MRKPDLWERIDQYEFPKGFDAKLTAAGIGWRQRQARREYLRFVYLMMISDKPLTPSGVVDAVWHVHLSYTREYWSTFCAEVLRQDLHHDPVQGSDANSLQNKQYLATLELYEREFGSSPDLGVWPTKQLWRHVIWGCAVAIVGTVLGLVALGSGLASIGTISLVLIIGGGGYALFNMPSGRPSSSVGGCGGLGGGE